LRVNQNLITDWDALDGFSGYIGFIEFVVQSCTENNAFIASILNIDLLACYGFYWFLSRRKFVCDFS